MLDFNSFYKTDAENCRPIIELLRDDGFDDILIVTHINPDGDAIGSSCALLHILGALGKRAAIYNCENFPKSFSYITDRCPKGEFSFENIITVDLASGKLLPDDFCHIDKIKAVIDHHMSNDLVCDIKLCQPHAAACGEQIFDLAVALNIPFDSYISLCLYTAIACDTGCFKYSNTTSSTFVRAAALTANSERVLLTKVNSVLFEKKSKDLMALEAEVVSGMEYYFDGKVCVSCVTLEMMKKNNIPTSGLMGIEQLSKTPDGVSLGITLKEKTENIFKVSMRSDDSIDSAYLCSLFGGGGHRAAAGCTVEGRASEVTEKLIEVLKKELS